MNYVRFGDIPSCGYSKKYRSGIPIGSENGVSCYNTVFLDGKWNVVLPTPLTDSTLNTIECLRRQECIRVFLISGENIGVGTDGEPVLKRVSIIKEIGYNPLRKNVEL